MRKENLVTGEHYHIYNRGVDKRNIIEDKNDLERFFRSIIEFNVVEPIGSIYENSFKIKFEAGGKGIDTSVNSSTPPLGRETSKLPLVEIVAYCINQNHFHLVLKQSAEGGISEFMKRLGGGYTKYFNTKYKRSGVLFQGVFRSKLVDSNEYLLRLSAYVNLNNRLKGDPSILSKTSWGEYLEEKNGICVKNIVLEQFKGSKEYESFALDALVDIKNQKIKDRELEDFPFI